MKPYNCNCLYEVQVREIKQQTDELLEALVWIQEKALQEGTIAYNKAEKLITKYSNNENT